MRSLGSTEAVNKAMWLYPKVAGFDPSDRWGHSACCYNGLVYIFGGCCGGLHFSDVLILDLDTMTWNTLATTGQRPGARDSHSSVVVGHRMIVLGGTNGSKKVNDLHVLDLRTNEWSSPKCEGTPPSPRESHTATVVVEEKLVIFGGSGEGEAHYLNDLHILDLKSMRWTSPEVRGNFPAPRDSHVTVAIGNKLLVYGGDCGDRYRGEVHVLDMDSLCWSRLVIQGPSPGVRAGHSAVAIGTKVFIIGGVGDKIYYNDVWILDVNTCSWTQLAIRGQQPQGRFSHTAVLTDSDIAIYGGCGEDERPLSELLILQLGAEHPNGRYNISLCKIFGSHCSQQKRKLTRGIETTLAGKRDKKTFIIHDSVDNLHPKRKKPSDPKGCDESEQEEHSLSLSQHSSPSQSDQEQTPIEKVSTPDPKANAVAHPFRMSRQRNQVQGNQRSNHIVVNQPEHNKHRSSQGIHIMGGETQRHLMPKQHLQHEVEYSIKEPEPSGPGEPQSVIGAEIHGKVDGAFDSGYLMTANVNGRIMRGVLFTPGTVYTSRGSMLPEMPNHFVTQQYVNPNCIGSTYGRASQVPKTLTSSEYNHHLMRKQSYPVLRTNDSSLQRSSSRLNNDLQDVVLTLGGGHGGL
ncbi:hypothetical protein ACHQM5_026248 [Ranunculus cassubicifolius]